MKKKFEKEISKLCQRFGTITVKKGLVSTDQIKEAFIEQLDDDLNGREHRLIGTILFEKGLMTWDQVDMVLKELFKPTAPRQRSGATKPGKNSLSGEPVFRKKAK
jgi:hypothetical protein